MNFTFGIHPVEEAIKSEKIIDKLFIQKGINHPGIDEIIQSLSNKQTTINYVPIEKLNRLAKGGNHQGVVATLSPIRFYSIEEVVEEASNKETIPLFLLLDQISDVRNFGAIIRTAECTGVSAIIIPKSGGAPITSDTVKTSAGAVFKIPICKVDHIKDAIYYLQASGIKTVAATEHTSKLVFDINFTVPVAIVMGSEGKGVSSGVLKLTEEKAALPLLGEINSLNVSVACGAFLYEVVRQRA